MDVFLQASFRDVPFQVEAKKQQFGRNTILHEYPQRDLPYVEDMGLASHILNVQGFVGGNANWKSERDALIAALNEPGPGILVHPWHGELTVCAHGPIEVTHQGGASRYVSFVMNFVETDGENASPSVSPHSQGLASSQAETCFATASQSLDSAISLAGQASAVVQNISSAVQEVASIVNKVQNGQYLQVASWLSGVLGFDGQSMGQLISAGKGLSSVLLPLFNSWSSGPGSARANSGKVAPAFFQVAQNTPKLLPPPNAGTVSSKSYQAQDAIYQFQREAATVAACQAVSLVTPATRQEAATLRQNVLEAVEAVFLSSQNDLFLAQLSDLRQVSLACLHENEGSAPDIVSVQENVSLPSLVVTWRQVLRETGKALSLTVAENDLIARNRIVHPGFLPGGEMLEVLRHAK